MVFSSDAKSAERIESSRVHFHANDSVSIRGFGEATSGSSSAHSLPNRDTAGPVVQVPHAAHLNLNSRNQAIKDGVQFGGVFT